MANKDDQQADKGELGALNDVISYANSTNHLSYCLYARKSTESDERQALSIDSQISEMVKIANREGLAIKELYRESHSSKESGSRPVFNQLLADLKSGKFNAILTWAPDRLSRNAGDLGSLVDLMDQGRLEQIRTYSQTFTNNPNEKFLLMILCSQAKLENDNRGINVKRGMKTRCELGMRPCAPPLGYYSIFRKGIRYVYQEPKQAPVIAEMFRLVVEEGYTGRKIQEWFEATGFKSNNGKKIALSLIYLMLKNRFYYGEFEYPRHSGILYKGKHKPIITREMFNKAQAQLLVPAKNWGAKDFFYAKFISCYDCGNTLVAEEKFKNKKDGSVTRHVYYHCTKSKNKDCKQKYLREDRLLEQLIQMVGSLNFSKNSEAKEFLLELRKFKRYQMYVSGESSAPGYSSENGTFIVDKSESNILLVDIQNFARHKLLYGSRDEKQVVMRMIKSRLRLKDRRLIQDKPEENNEEVGM